MCFKIKKKRGKEGGPRAKKNSTLHPNIQSMSEKYPHEIICIIFYVKKQSEVKRVSSSAFRHLFNHVKVIKNIEKLKIGAFKKLRKYRFFARTHLFIYVWSDAPATCSTHVLPVTTGKG